jgi:hypothetical protein
MLPPTAQPKTRTAIPRAAPGCLTRLLGLLGLALLVGIAAWLWDALIEAPWAYSLASLVGQDEGGHGTLTGPWLGEFTSPSRQLHGVLALQIERRQWGSAGRTRGVTGPSYPDFAGTARLCGLSTDPKTTAPRDLWGYANRDGSLVHAVISFAPGHDWTLGALNGAWNRDAGSLTLAGKLDNNGGSASGGTRADDRQPTTITLKRSTDRDTFERRCRARGSKLPA